MSISIRKVVIASDVVSDFVSKYNDLCDVTTAITGRITGGTGSFSIVQNNGTNISIAQNGFVTGENNTENGVNGMCGGGSGNTVGSSANRSSIVGGQNHSVTQPNDIILGGEKGSITSQNSGIIAGSGNTVSGQRSVIVGGSHNSSLGTNATVVGGANNTGNGTHSAIIPLF